VSERRGGLFSSHFPPLFLTNKNAALRSEKKSRRARYPTAAQTLHQTFYITQPKLRVPTGVENAGNADEKEVRTHEVPEDDVPGEYLDKD